MKVAADPMAVHRPWWEAWWCIALALLLSAAPLLWWAIPPFTGAPDDLERLGADSALSGNVTWAMGLAPVIAAASMVWLSRAAHGRVQPTTYFALPFAYNAAFLGGALNETVALALALAALALWLRMAWLTRPRAGVFVILSLAVWATHPFGWLCLLVMIVSAELARERAVETDGMRRGWVESGWRAAIGCLPLAPPVLMLPAAWPSGGDWVAGLALKPDWLMSALQDRWPMFDIACMIVVALVIYRSFGSRRFVHAPMLVAAAIGLMVLFMALPADMAVTGRALAAQAIVLALLSIRFNARVKQRRRAALALVAIAFLVVRTAVGTASLAMGSHERGALDQVTRGKAFATGQSGDSAAAVRTFEPPGRPLGASARAGAPLRAR